MDPLRDQVLRARRRLVGAQFLARAPWCLLAGLIVAAVAIAVPRLRVIESLPSGWDLAWLSGGACVGLVAAGLWTLFSHRSELDAAIEIDRRFELRERVASSLSLSADERSSDAGRALINDAVRAASRIEVAEKFRVRPGRRAWLPLVPAVFAIVPIALIDHRQAAASAEARQAADITEQIRRSAESARKKMAERRKEAKRQGLDLAEGLFEKIEQGTRELANRKHVDRAKAAAQLNDLANQLQARQRQLGGKDGLKRPFQSMKQLGSGPADKAAEALEQGDFQTARKEMQQLEQQLRDKSLDERAQQQLAEQLANVQEKIAAAAQAHQQTETDLQQQLDDARRQGNLAQAGEAQQHLDRLRQQRPLMDQLGQFGQQLGQCQQGLEQGSTGQAAAALAQMAQQLGQMQQQTNEARMLDEALEQLQQAKNAMACSQCQGRGCAECQTGAGGSLAEGGDAGGSPLTGERSESGEGRPGQGIGSGQAGGLLSGGKNQTEYQYHDEQLRPKLGAGPGRFDGLVEGPNIKGQVVEAIKQEMATLRSEPAAPLTSERLPRNRREHAEEYFELLRERD